MISNAGLGDGLNAMAHRVRFFCLRAAGRLRGRAEIAAPHRSPLVTSSWRELGITDHEPTSARTLRFTSEDEKLTREGFDSLSAAGKLGAVVAQFPISFKTRSRIPLMCRNSSPYFAITHLRSRSGVRRGAIEICCADFPLWAWPS